MHKATDMLDQLDKMEFWLEVDGCQTDSDPIELVLEYLLKGKTVTVGIHKDYRDL